MPNEFFQQKVPKKGLNRKSERHHQILHIQNTLGTKFQLKLTFLNFLIKLIQKGISDLKNENHHQILHIQLSLGFKFESQHTVLIFGKTIFSNKDSSKRKQKEQTSPPNSLYLQ